MKCGFPGAYGALIFFLAIVSLFVMVGTAAWSVHSWVPPRDPDWRAYLKAQAFAAAVAVLVMAAIIFAVIWVAHAGVAAECRP